MVYTLYGLPLGLVDHILFDFLEFVVHDVDVVQDLPEIVHLLFGEFVGVLFGGLLFGVFGLLVAVFTHYYITRLHPQINPRYSDRCISTAPKYRTS